MQCAWALVRLTHLHLQWYHCSHESQAIQLLLSMGLWLQAGHTSWFFFCFHACFGFFFFLFLDACYSWNDVANRFLMGCDQVKMDVCLYIYTTEKCGTLIQSALGMHSSACSKHCMLNIYMNTSLSTSTTYYIYCYLQGISFMESFLKLSVFLFCKVCHYCWCNICHIS